MGSQENAVAVFVRLRSTSPRKTRRSDHSTATSLLVVVLAAHAQCVLDARDIAMLAANAQCVADARDVVILDADARCVTDALVVARCVADARVVVMPDVDIWFTYALVTWHLSYLWRTTKRTNAVIPARTASCGLTSPLSLVVLYSPLVLSRRSKSFVIVRCHKQHPASADCAQVARDEAKWCRSVLVLLPS